MCRPIRSVIIIVTKQIGLPLGACPILLITGMITDRVGLHSSSETQGQLVEAGKRLNGRGKKLGEEKSLTKVGAPGILLLIDQFRNHLKSLPVIGHKNIFCAQSESSSFRVTFVTSYSKVFTAKLFARHLFTCSCRRVSLYRKVPLKREP